MSGRCPFAVTTAKVPRGCIRVVLVVTQALRGPGVSHHSQLRHLPLELVRVGSTRLAHEDPGSGVQLHGVRRALHLHHLWFRVAAVVEGHLVLEDGQREAAPLVHHAGHVEAGRLVRRLRVRLGVEEAHPLAAATHGAQLDADVHELLGAVGDGEEDRRTRRGWRHVEEQREMAIERIGDVNQGRLTRRRRRAEGVNLFPPRSQDPGDLLRRGVSQQLLQRHAALLGPRRRLDDVLLVCGDIVTLGLFLPRPATRPGRSGPGGFGQSGVS